MLAAGSGSMAIGWVHNLNAYWEKHYYATSIKQNFFGCTAPPTPQQVALPGFAAGTDYHITWFPTRMNDTVHPADAVDATGTGTVLLDLSTALLGDTVHKYMDTLHLDYGFIISLSPVHRSMAIPQEADTAASTDWDFSLYPNPAHDLLNLVLPDNTAKDIAIYDLSGRQVYRQTHAAGPVVRIPIGRFSSGSYGVRVSDAASSRVKLLIIQ